MYLDHRTLPEIARRVAAAAFPGYNGRHFKLEQRDRVNVTSYWDGGSRDSFVFVRLADMATVPIASINPLRDAGHAPVELPEGVVCVEHSIFCGKDMGLTFYVRDAKLLPLPALEGVTDDMRLVLTHTASLKNTYGGRSDIRFHEANERHGVTRERWDVAFSACVAAGFLNRAGAIQAAGRNVASAPESSPFRAR